MRRIIIPAVMIILFSTGCKDGTLLPKGIEITDLEMVRIIALDRGKAPDAVKVSIMARGQEGGNAESGGDGKGEGQRSKLEAIILTAEGKSVLDTVRNFQTYTDKQMFLGHIDFYLIGEEAARENLSKYVDFISRDDEVRLNSTIFIVEGPAGKILEISNASDYFLPERLKNLSQNISLLSISSKMKLLDLIGRLDENGTFGIAVPCIRQTVFEKQQENGEIGLKNEFTLDGYAIIKDLKLVGFIHCPVSRGYNFICNKVFSGTIDLSDPEGNTVTTEILGSRTSIVPRIKGNRLVGVDIRTQFETNIDEVHSTEDIFREDTLRFLERQQSDRIKDEMEKCVEAAKEYKTDFIGIGEKVNLRHPILWKGLKEQWPLIFADLPVTVEVESRIDRSYNIREPNGYTKEGGKR